MYLLSATGMGIFAFIYFAMLNSLVPALMFIGIVLSWVMHGLMYGPQAALIAECFTHDCAIVAARWVIISPLSQAAAPHHSSPRSCWLPLDQGTRLPRTSP